MRYRRLLTLFMLLALVCSSCGLTARDAADIAGDIAVELLTPEDGQDPAQTPETQEPEAQDPDIQEPDTQEPEAQDPDAQEPETQEPETQDPDTQEPDTQDPSESRGVEYGEYYYDVESVVLYLEAFGELPENFITKNEARDLGWSGGSVEDYMEGAAIGGDRFGNYEGLLPQAGGRTYTECDIDTLGSGSRGAKRLVFSNDGLYFYTSDHYETFSEVTVEDGQVSW